MWSEQSAENEERKAALVTFFCWINDVCKILWNAHLQNVLSHGSKYSGWFRIAFLTQEEEIWQLRNWDFTFSPLTMVHFLVYWFIQRLNKGRWHPSLSHSVVIKDGKPCIYPLVLRPTEATDTQSSGVTPFQQMRFGFGTFFPPSLLLYISLMHSTV